ncbi:hypothetical protein GGI12_004686 [Dipsacomyces acuminosporus]|nr:hypothetical protein GGI12_004686 [Dipsacomyces acuminosporus]
MGVRDVQVEELYSLDSESLRAMEPVYGLIFLFKWQPGAAGTKKQSTGSDDGDSSIDTDGAGVYFAQQIIQNACATQAILSILLNRNEDIELGDTLNNFRSFSIDLPPDMRGLALTNCDQIRDVHNSFVRPDSFLTDFEKPKRLATEDDDLFHFISYVPVDGRLYELDGLRPGPIDHGLAGNSWLDMVGEVIQKRMSEYAQGEIRFNLMAVIGDRRKHLNEQISSVDADIAKLLTRLEALRLDDRLESKDEASKVENEIGRLNHERADLEHRVELENGKFERYKFDNALRKHNFIPLIYQLVRGMAQTGKLQPAIQAAKQKAKDRASRQQQD